MLDAQSMVTDNRAILQYGHDIERAINVAFNGRA
jgi:hypothetical protein